MSRGLGLESELLRVPVSPSRACIGSQESGQVLSGSKTEVREGRDGLGKAVKEVAQRQPSLPGEHLEDSTEALDDFFIRLKTPSRASHAAGISQMFPECQ